jgi:hypothetical protein
MKGWCTTILQDLLKENNEVRQVTLCGQGRQFDFEKRIFSYQFSPTQKDGIDYVGEKKVN